MKGYCVDVRGFSVNKKKLVVEAIDELIGTCTYVSDRAMNIVEVFTSVYTDGEIYCGALGAKYESLTSEQLVYLASFDDLMSETGFNYIEDGVEGFKAKSPNKTRPLITREQYDAVMAQSDKRTFTKALDDLLAIEKEQLLDESAIRIKQLERESQKLNSFVELKDEQLECLLNTVKRLEKDNEYLSKSFESWSEFCEDSDNSKQKIEGKLEKHKRISGVLSLLLISSFAAQLAVIFLR